MATPAPAIPLRIDSVVKRFGDLTAVAGVSLGRPRARLPGSAGPQRRGQIHTDSQHCGTRAARFRQRPRLRTSGRLRGGARGVGLGAAGTGAVSAAHLPRKSGSLRTVPGTCAAKPCDEGIAWCLEWAALADRAGATVKTLSGGMRRRLNMAAGLIHRPRIVLLDEPTVGVDPQSRNRIFEMVDELREPRHHGDLHHALHGRSRAPVRYASPSWIMAA